MSQFIQIKTNSFTGQDDVLINLDHVISFHHYKDAGEVLIHTEKASYTIKEEDYLKIKKYIEIHLD